jgi:response regulator of citrate/malate metabolism
VSWALLSAVSVDSLSPVLGLSRLAWRYLERLTDDGTDTRRTDYGKAGRPRTRYVWR